MRSKLESIFSPTARMTPETNRYSITSGMIRRSVDHKRLNSESSQREPYENVLGDSASSHGSAKNSESPPQPPPLPPRLKTPVLPINTPNMPLIIAQKSSLSIKKANSDITGYRTEQQPLKTFQYYGNSGHGINRFEFDSLKILTFLFDSTQIK